MARETIVRLTDDISGGDADATVSFSYRGTNYEIDLSEKNVKAFDKDIARYVDHARRVTRAQGAKRESRSPGRDYDLAALRNWAAEKGIEIPRRGRISQATIDKYKAALGK